MKAMLTMTAWAFVLLVILFAAINPASGALYDNPLACLGVGLIGLGLMRQARQRAAPAA